MAGTLHSQEYKTLIATLVRARQDSGLSQAQLAVKISRPPSFVAKVELCERRLDVLEFCVWASIISNDPLSLLEEHIPQGSSKMPR
jgi:transcriptional regulator with XRE-family HTH domain